MKPIAANEWERLVHKAFHSAQLEGEWFRYNIELADLPSQEFFPTAGNAQKARGHRNEDAAHIEQQKLDKLAYSVNEAARMVGVEKHLMKTLLSHGLIKAVQIGRQPLIPRIELTAALLRRRFLCEGNLDN